MTEGIAYIISNQPKTKHKDIFERLCNRSIKCAKNNLSLPVAVLSFDSSKQVKADYHIDAKPFMKEYIKQNKGENFHGLVAAELLKTHICEWSPFDKTLYLDCDAFVQKKEARDYIDILDSGFELSVATCVTMEWKDSIGETPVRSEIFGKVPRCFPYWNFGIFGSNKKSAKLMVQIREHFLSYCFKGSRKFGSCPHAQPALVRAAYDRSPDHRIFTMPIRYNCHFAAQGGYIFSGSPVILHLWKDIRSLILGIDNE